ncbi:isochorismatase family protein [Pseudoalteromonas xiamenensis]
MTTALIIIDTQDSFFHTPYWETSHFESFKQNMSDLVNYFQANNLPIVKVLHVDDVDQNSPFCLLNGFVKPMDFLPSKYDRVVHKTVHNAFTDTGLLRWLTRNGIRKLVISGIRTEQCCETTTRVASDLGFAVEFVLDATLTFAMTSPFTSKVHSVEEIHAHTALVLNKRFATITSAQDYGISE